ncbi:MAG: preprotein translocase subunit SecE [Clostridia bacterium]|nr:preprotein translocase subunit SecE [Clostridia bacterium]
MAKEKKKEKKGRFAGMKEFLVGVKLEMSKVVWPTKKEIVSFTAVVLVACAFFTIAFWAIDTGFLAALKAVLNIDLA